MIINNSYKINEVKSVSIGGGARIYRRGDNYYINKGGARKEISSDQYWKLYNNRSSDGSDLDNDNSTNDKVSKKDVAASTGDAVGRALNVAMKSAADKRNSVKARANNLSDKSYGSDPKLDKLVNSYDSLDREDAADMGYGLDKLIDDKDEFVRRAVARQGYGLDKLMNDDAWGVRSTVAGTGYGLDTLYKDKHPGVRRTSAKAAYDQGRDDILKELSKDDDYHVKDDANYYLKKLSNR